MRAIEGVGIGLRKPHYDAVLATSRRVDWLEIVSENFMAVDGRPSDVLARCLDRFTVIPHGVALSLGSAAPPRYLEELHALVERLDPPFFSDHLCISSVGGIETFDLLPVPFSDEAASWMGSRAKAATTRVGRPLVLENITWYARMPGSRLPETTFLERAITTAGASLLLDLNNLFVNAQNHGFDPFAWLEALTVPVGQIHLAGHCREGSRLLDTHDGPVAAPVWELFGAALRRFGPVPTLIEWDQKLPSLDVVLDEADRARRLMEKHAR